MVDDVVDFGFGHGGEEREGDAALPVAFGIGEIGGVEVVSLLVVGHVVERFVMHGKADASFNQGFDESRPVHAGLGTQDEPEEVPGVVFFDGGDAVEAGVGREGKEENRKSKV